MIEGQDASLKNQELTDVVHALSQGGAIAQCIPDFQPREAQQLMSAEVVRLLQEQSVSIVEAGTGVGKTFAYLNAIFAMGKKAIVSTGSKTLQDQLFMKDLPLVRGAYHSGMQCALLKGRSNYLCHYRLHKARTEGMLNSRQQVHWLQEVQAWSHRLK